MHTVYNNLPHLLGILDTSTDVCVYEQGSPPLLPPPAHMIPPSLVAWGVHRYLGSRQGVHRYIIYRHDMH